MKAITCLLLGLSLSLPSSAEMTATDELATLQSDWARIKYQVPSKDREAQFKQLAEQSSGYLQAHPDSAELEIWHAIILSTYAGEVGGLSALSLVKEAKGLLEESVKTDPQALQGSAYTSLGTLYYQVPGWPIGFGSDTKAEEYLKQALVINPEGIDSNYFYADFLIENKRKDEAQPYLERALNAPARASRPVADEGRRKEIKSLMLKLK